MSSLLNLSSEIWPAIVTKLKAHPIIIPAVAILIATMSFICEPASRGYIRVRGSRIDFKLPPFQKCEVSFRTPIHITSDQVALPERTDSTGLHPATIITTNVEQVVKVLIINGPAPSDLQSTSGVTAKLDVSIFTTLAFDSEIESITVDDRPLELKTFFINNLSGSKEFIHFRYIRETLANIVSYCNDMVSNICLTIMFFGVVCLAFWKLLPMEMMVFYSDPHFEKHLTKKLKIANFKDTAVCESAFNEYVAHWNTWDRIFKYLQAIGPAMGFMLTVTSLIQALHPAIPASGDLSGFLNGIHIAMISTFVGLLLRLFALESARVNDKLLDRAHTLLSKNT